MKDDKKVPQLRFPEFTDAWKQRELNEIADTIDTGKSIFSKSNIGKFKILGSTGVIGFDEDYDYEGSFLLTARVGANAGNLYRSSGKVKITDNTVFIKSKFIDYLFYSLEKFNLKRLSFGTGQPLIKSSELKKLNISVPCDENEITKIEHFFITIDRTITLQQRKLNSLKKLKKGLLQKIFPKNGENIPEIRFPEFSDAWKQRRFSELVIIERGGSPRPISKFITNDSNGLSWVKIGDAPEQGNYITSTAEKIKPEGLSKTREVHPGDLILSNSMSFGRPYIMAIDGCIHDGWLLIRNDKNIFDLKFLCTLLGSESMLSQYKALAAGSTVNNLNKELVGNTKISFPEKKEQIKFGQFFSKLDNLITLQQRKLESLQKLKKGLLQQMFI